MCARRGIFLFSISLTSPKSILILREYKISTMSNISQCSDMLVLQLFHTFSDSTVPPYNQLIPILATPILATPILATPILVYDTLRSI